MWATLATWLLGDGEVAELAVGDILRNVGLRLNSSVLRPATGPSVGAFALNDAVTGIARYRLRGTCLAKGRTQTALIELEDAAILVEPADVRPVSGAVDHGALERYSADFRPPEEGQVAEAEGWLDVVAEYEWDAFELPDARRDWVLAGILLVGHELVALRDDTRDSVTTGAVLQVDPRDQLRRSADMVAGNRYLVDLRAA